MCRGTNRRQQRQPHRRQWEYYRPVGARRSLVCSRWSATDPKRVASPIRRPKSTRQSGAALETSTSNSWAHPRASQRPLHLWPQTNKPATRCRPSPACAHRGRLRLRTRANNNRLPTEVAASGPQANQWPELALAEHSKPVDAAQRTSPHNNRIQLRSNERVRSRSKL